MLQIPFLALPALLALPCGTGETEVFAAVVHASNDTESISSEELRNILLGRQRYWKDRRPIELLLNRSGTAEKDFLLDHVYKMSPKRLKRHWIELVYRNKIAEPPRSYPSARTILKAIERSARSIGVVAVESLGDSGSYRVLAIDGKLPGNEGYFLTRSASDRDAASSTLTVESGWGAARNDDEFDELRSEELGPKIRLRGFGHVQFTVANTDPSAGPGDTSDDFALGGLDLFITSSITDRLSFLNETVFEPTDEGEYVLDVERVILKYEFDDRLNLQAGRFHTTLGYWNETYHHGEWLQTPVGRPRIVDFEDEDGLLPIHLVGVVLKGVVDASRLRVEYALEVGNGRGPAPDPPQITVDANDAKAVNVAVAVEPHAIPGLCVGGGVYVDSIPANADPMVGPVHASIDEIIFNVNAQYEWDDWEVLAELFLVDHDGDDGHATSDGYYVQAARSYGDWTPYVRFEGVTLDDADTFFTSVDDLTRFAVGVRWDYSPWSALKLHYAHSLTEEPGGAETQEDALILQASFTF